MDQIQGFSITYKGTLIPHSPVRLTKQEAWRSFYGYLPNSKVMKKLKIEGFACVPVTLSVDKLVGV